MVTSGGYLSSVGIRMFQVDAGGYLIKREVADLLQIDDPYDLGGTGPLFRFPFQTIESVIPLGDRRLGILDDNNYPFSSARHPGEPDPNEFIIIKLDRPIRSFARPDRDEDHDHHGSHHGRGGGR